MLYNSEKFEVKFRCYFIVLVFLLNAIYPSFSIHSDSTKIQYSTVPICTEYGLKYLPYGSNDNDVPQEKKHCDICLIVKKISDGFVSTFHSRVVQVNYNNYFSHYFKIDSFNNSYLNNIFTRAPPVDFI